MQQSSMREEVAGQIIKRFETLRSSSSRGNLNSQCQEIAERIWPSQERLFSSLGENTTEGEKRGSKAYDTTPSSALNKFASILDSLLTPMDQTWHRIIPDLDYFMKSRRVVLWLEELNRCIFKKRYAPTSGFVAQNQLVYKGLGAYGNSGLFTDEYVGRRGELGYRYKNVHLSELYFLENHQGLVEDVYRYYKATAHQIMKRWKDNAPPTVKAAAKTEPDRKFMLIHVVCPREDVDFVRRDFKGMDFASYYISVEDKWLLEEGGYEEFPYGVSRYEVVPGEGYARSPAMEALAGMKVLNEQKKTLLTHGHQAIAPTLFAHDDGVLDTYNLRPAAVNFGGVNADGKLLVHTMPQGNVMFTKEMMDDERFGINDMFLVPLFQMLEKTPQMTATEVMEKVKEKGILLAPTVGRQYNEYHGRVIEREIGLELRQNRALREGIPPEFIEAGAEFRLRYESPMARMQRAEEASGFMRTVETAMNIATTTQNPAPLDHFNWDVIVPEMAEIAGVPKRWLNDQDTIDKARADRSAQSQDEQDVQAGPAAAAMLKAQAVASKAGAA